VAKGPKEDQSLGQVFFEDLRRTPFSRAYIDELKDLYRFYLDEESRTRLASMGRVRQAFVLLGWTAKSLLLKLSPARRILLVLAVLLMLLGDTQFEVLQWGVDARFGLVAFLVLLFVLMLELKDKLLVRDEIEIAREVQLALLPHEDPQIPGWSVWSYSRPANDVGGDLVDYIELDGFRHGVALGDVAGKGLGAALLSSKLQATLRALTPETINLEDLGHRANTIFLRDGIENRFATLFYIEVEHHSGQARYLNAGHNPAFVMRPDGMQRLGASSLPLGMLPSASYEECSLEFQHGEVLVAYSDGLTEAENERGEEFGLERAERVLQETTEREPERIGRRILDEVDRFVGRSRPGDDLSLVILVRQ
jgi:hypothetical protein